MTDITTDFEILSRFSAPARGTTRADRRWVLMVEDSDEDIDAYVLSEIVEQLQRRIAHTLDD